jgi:excisionase family DNA binding protein
MAATKTKGAKKPAKSAVAKNGVPAPDLDDVLTLAEAAAYLRVAEAAVVDSVNAEGLPGRQVGGEWRFLKSSLREWLNGPKKPAGNEAFLALAGAWKDDPDAEEMLKEIYKKRGRPMSEGEG